jgi:hypothetical protein
MKQAEILADRIIEKLHMNPDLRPRLIEVCNTEDPKAIDEFIAELFWEQMKAIRGEN